MLGFSTARLSVGPGLRCGEYTRVMLQRRSRFVSVKRGSTRGRLGGAKGHQANKKKPTKSPR